MSELQEVCGALEGLARHIQLKEQALRDVARALRRDAEDVRAAAAGCSGDAARRTQSVVAAILDGARECDRSADALADAAGAGFGYVRRNCSGVAGEGSQVAAGPAGSSDAAGHMARAAGHEFGKESVPGGSAGDEPGAPRSLGDYVPIPEVPLDAATIRASASAQGGLGNCGVAATCNGLRNFDPTIAERVLTMDPDGTYSAQLWWPDASGVLRRVDVSVAATAPEGASGSLYCTPGGSEAGFGPSWVTVVEKGLAALVGSYEGLVGIDTGLVAGALTGQSFVSQRSLSFEEISLALRRGPVMVGSSRHVGEPRFLWWRHKTPLEETIVPRHWYSVVSVPEYRESGGARYVLQVENPWGTGDATKPHYITLDEETFRRDFDAVVYRAGGE